MAKAKGWTNEQAQAALTEMSTAIGEQHTRFRTELNAHPEVGGAALEQAQLNATRALDRFLPASTPEGAQLRTAITKSGYGNFAPLVVLLSRIGKAMGEDRSLATDRAAGSGQVDIVELFYGKQPAS